MRDSAIDGNAMFFPCTGQGGTGSCIHHVLPGVFLHNRFPRICYAAAPELLLTPLKRQCNERLQVFKDSAWKVFFLHIANEPLHLTFCLRLTYLTNLWHESYFCCKIRKQSIPDHFSGFMPVYHCFHIIRKTLPRNSPKCSQTHGTYIAPCCADPCGC